VGGHLLLVGMMGSGKSTVAPLVARALGRPCVDTDEEVARRCGATVAEIFERLGEKRFREEERSAIAALAERRPFAVVSVGGGAVTDPANRALLHSAGTVVWLRARPSTLLGRVGRGSGRPLLGDEPERSLVRIERERRELYSDSADAVVDTDGLGPREVADRVAAILKARGDVVASSGSPAT
jgi:shikimate kinase